MSNELKIGDRVKVIDMDENVLKSDLVIDPIGMVGTVVSIDLGYEEAPYGVFFPEEEPDGATDAYTSSAAYPELYRADELEKQ
jgi:hypothetical protein